MTPEQKMRLDDVNSKCLTMCIGMLERVNGVRIFSLHGNAHPLKGISCRPLKRILHCMGFFKLLLFLLHFKEDSELCEKGTKAPCTMLSD